MTVATVTICGVVLEAGDIPQDPHFKFDEDNKAWLFIGWPKYDENCLRRQSKDDPLAKFAQNLLHYLDELHAGCCEHWIPLIAAFARCWFLDRAEELRGDFAVVDMPLEKYIEFKKCKASAAKWAQIGRNACKQ